MQARSDPFQLLLEIAARAQSGSEVGDSALKIHAHWTGIGFSVMGERLVAPFGQVTEILMVPPLTRLPRVQPWARGVATVRGRLLPMVGLVGFLGGKPGNWRSQRVLVVDLDDMYCGLIVDEVYGLKHFATDAYREKSAQLPATLQEFVEGSYVAADGAWSVFRPDRLIRNERFLDAAQI